MLKPTKSHWLKLALLLGIVVPISIFIGLTDFHLVRLELSAIGFNFLTLIFSTFIAYLLGTLGWWICLGDQRSQIKIHRLFAIRQIGETVGLYNPSSIVGGDLLKATLLSSYDIPANTASESVAVSRLTAIISQFVLLTFAASWLLFSRHQHLPQWLDISLILLIVSLVSIGILTLLLLNKKVIRKRKTSSQNVNFFKKLQEKTFELLGQCQFFYQHRNREFWLSFLFFLLHWIVGSFEFYLILYLTGYDVTIMQGILMDMGVVIIKSAVGFIPGQLGIEELANQLVLLAVGIGTGSLWLTVSILRRARQLVWIAGSALLYLILPKTVKNTAFTDGSSIC